MRNKILIVDDETDIVSMLKDYFELNGYDKRFKKLKNSQTLFYLI